MELLLAILGSSALATLISSIFNLVAAKKTVNNGVEAGVQILLYDRIKCLSRKYIMEQQVRPDDLEDLIKMHQVYHSLQSKNTSGATDFIDNLVTQVCKLSIKT